MGIKFLCEHCQQLLNIKSRYAGQVGSCPLCDKDICVPQESAIRPNRKFRKYKPSSDSVPQILEDDQKTVVNIVETQEFERDQLDPPASAESKVPNTPKKSRGRRQKTKPLRSQTPASRPSNSSASADLSPSNVVPEPVESRSANDGMTPPTPTDESDLFLLDKPTNPWLKPNAPDPIESGMKKVWYIRHPQDGEIGPIKGKHINKMIEAKEITPMCFVWREDWEDWLRADVVFKQLEIRKTTHSENDRVFTDPNCPIPKSYLKQATAEERQKKRQQILLVVAIVVGIVTISLLAWLLATLL